MLIRASEAAREVRPYTNWELHYMLGSDVFSKLDKSDRLTSKFLFMKFTHIFLYHSKSSLPRFTPYATN